MRRPDGVAMVFGDAEFFRFTGKPAVVDLLAGGAHIEQEIDTFMCGHCQAVVHVKPMQDPAELGGVCTLCARHLCPKCVNAGTCDPFEEKIERAERLGEYERLSKL